MNVHPTSGHAVVRLAAAGARMVDSTDVIRVIQVSDSHLSPSAPHADANWAVVVDEIRRRAPDLVVHTGDISLDGAHDPADLRHARRLLDRLPVRWLAIPGNHDIGDVGDDAEDGEAVSESRRSRYRDHFGDGSWMVTLDGWRLVGVDIQTLASPLPASARLWAWLDGVTDGPQPTAVFLHRPLLPLAAGDVDEPARYVGEPTRARLSGLLARRPVRLVASGHVHQWRTADLDGQRHVWAPSTWATLPDRIQPVLGAKVTGIVEIELGASASVALVRPAGITSPTIGEHFDSPYAH